MTLKSYKCVYLFIKEMLGTSGICVKGKLLPDPGCESLTQEHYTITPDISTGYVQEWYVSQDTLLSTHLYDKMYYTYM